MKKTICSLFLFLLFAFSQVAGAAESLDLERALLIAWSRNPQIEEARREQDASRGRFLSKSVPEGPEVTFEVGGFKSQEVNGEKVTPDKNLDTLEVIQPLDYPPTWFLKSSIAHDDVQIAQNDLYSAWADVRSKVQRAFFSALYAEEAVKVFQSNLEASQGFLDRVESKYQSGGASKAERLRTRIEFSRAQAELLEAQSTVQTQKAELNLLLGQSAETSISLEGTLAYDAIKIQEEQVLDAALLARSDLKAERLRMSRLKKESIKSRFDVLPKPFVGFNRTDTDYDDDYSIILGAKLPLWDFNIGAIQETDALKAKQETRLKAFERDVESAVRLAVRELELARKKVEIQKKIQEEGNELLREITLRYEEGEMHFLSYLESLKAVKEAKLSYLDAFRNYQEKVALLERVTQNAPLPKGEKIR